MPKSRRRTPKRSGPGGRPGSRSRQSTLADDPGIAELVADLDERLAAGHPLAVLELASSLLDGLDPRNAHPFERQEASDLPPLPELLDVFVAAGPAPGALAGAMSRLVDDDLVRSRVAREVGARSILWPAWLQRMATVEVVGAQQFLDPLRDRCHLVIHTRFEGFDLTAVVSVDFRGGTVVEDAFFSDQRLTRFQALWAENAPEGVQPEVETLTPADVRARIEEAVERAAITWPRPETDSWPASRPLLEWLLRRLPAGGSGFVRPAWSETDRAALVDRFVASEGGAAFDSPDDRSVVDDLLWYGTDYGYGDPLRWSPLAVEILLIDWYPRKVVADQAYLRRMPAVLRALVPFGHAQAGLGAALTQPTLGAIDLLEAEYRTLIGQRRPQGPAALLDAMGLVEPPDLAELRLDVVADYVGGRRALAALDDEPLPDEPFDWTGLPPELHDRVAAVLALCDGCCDDLFDVEHRTAVRRLFRDAVLGRPRAFSGRGSSETAAAALCWLVARANDAAVYPQGVPTRLLMSYFGLASSPSTRITTMRQAVGAEHCSSPGSVGSARYLVSSQRRYLMDARDS